LAPNEIGRLLSRGEPLTSGLKAGVNKFLPGQFAIDAFGDGGFRFGGMSHLGSVLALPNGMRAWRPTSIDALIELDFNDVVSAKELIDFLLIGTGRDMVRPSVALMKKLLVENINTDFMSTSSAVHTFNVMLTEGRRVAAALIAVDLRNE
jgi:uncharacterized protein